MSTAYDAPKGRSNFLPPACDRCQDHGEVVTYFRGGEEPEFAPCDCATGLLLAAQISEQLTALWATIPLKEV